MYVGSMLEAGGKVIGTVSASHVPWISQSSSYLTLTVSQQSVIDYTLQMRN